MLDQVLLQKAQEDVLARLVEAARNVATEDRQRFVAPNAPNRERYTFTHPGLPGGQLRVYPGDVEALAGEGLLSVAQSPRGTAFAVDVAPRGFEYRAGGRLSRSASG